MTQFEPAKKTTPTAKKQGVVTNGNPNHLCVSKYSKAIKIRSGS